MALFTSAAYSPPQACCCLGGGTTATYPTVPKVGDVQSVVYGQNTRGGGPVFPGWLPVGGNTSETQSPPTCQHSETELPELKGKCPAFKMDGFFNTCFFFFLIQISLSFKSLLGARSFSDKC